MPPSLPQAIGKYTIERFIESGGMGDVYLARDPVLDRAVAIKFLREGFDSQEMRERFEREARAAGRLSHPNIVTIYEFGIFDSRPFIAMEFVRGEPLSKLIRRRESIPLVRKLEMMEGLCSGLAHAHKTGMVHRDVKPANLMVDDDGGPLKILDFGIVRMAGSGLTSHGVLVGTINYMSPEQITGRGTIDLRSDVFAVGAVLHEVFTYQRAFPGEMTDVLYKIVHAQPESAAVLSPGLDPGIVRAIDQCLEKAPERRYQDLGVLRRELSRIRQRLELLQESETHGHTAPTVRQPKEPASSPSRASGAHRTPVSGTPAPSTPSSPPSAPPSAPQTPTSDRARRAAEAAAALERAQRAAEEARLELEREAEEQARLEAERLERERLAREGAERARLARERAQAEQARLERQQAERIRAEQARAEQARIEQAREQARQEQARLEQERLDRARAEEAERARIEHERQEQARLEDARKAREQAEKERVEAQRKAEAEARLEIERRAQEALNRQIASAGELVVRQDFDGASRVVQAILAAQPNHTLARNLEREIARGVGQRTRAAAVVERARSLFDARPGEAMELLERFTPAHGLVDSALADMRDRHAARERERLRREKQAQRQQQIAAVTTQAGALARNRAVQAGVAAVLVLVVVIASWSTLFPPKPIEPSTVDTGTPASGPATAGRERPAGTASSRESPTVPVAGGETPKETPRIDAGATAPPTRTTAPGGSVVPPAAATAAATPKATGQPTPSGGAAGPTPTGGQQPTGSDRTGGAVAVAPPAGGTAAKPDPVEEDAVRTEPAPAPETPRDTARVTVPAGPDRGQIAQAEILSWINEYKVAFQHLDQARVRSMNPPSPFKAAQYKTASVTFSNVDIRVRDNGQAAVLKADVQYQYEFSRGEKRVTPVQPIEWPMRKTPNGWVANP